MQVASNVSEAPCWAAIPSSVAVNIDGCHRSTASSGNLYSESANSSHTNEYSDIVGPQPGAADRLVWSCDRISNHRQQVDCGSRSSPRECACCASSRAEPGGVKFVVDMRAQLRALDARRDPDLAALDTDLKDLLATWFDVGLARDAPRHLGRAGLASWRSSPGYEAVHDVRGWIDLKDRLDRDRRCFAFFHPAMPDEPLIFVEVALVDSLAGNVQEAARPELAGQGETRRPKHGDLLLDLELSGRPGGDQLWVMR